MIITVASDKGGTGKTTVAVSLTVGRIPYDNVVTEAMVRGFPVTEYLDGRGSEALEEIWMRGRAKLL
jgi:MinD superfamily P-loop ATPase